MVKHPEKHEMQFRGILQTSQHLNVSSNVIQQIFELARNTS